MAKLPRFLVLSLLAAALVGVSGWMLYRDLAHPAGTAAGTAAAGTDPGRPGERRIKVTLFYVAEDGTRLVPVDRDIAFAEGPGEQARRILEAQLLPPAAPLLAPIPAAATLRGVYITDAGEAYADFSDAIRSTHPGGSTNELFTVYSIVSVLTVNLPAIKSVQILIDGHEVDTLAGHVDLRRPLPRSAQWLEAPAVR